MDQQSWHTVLADHFRNKFRRDDWSAVAAGRLTAQWESLARAARLDGRRQADLTFTDFEDALEKVRPSAAPGGDSVPGSVFAVMAPIAHH